MDAADALAPAVPPADSAELPAPEPQSPSQELGGGMADAEAQPSSGKSKVRSAIKLHMVHFIRATQGRNNCFAADEPLNAVSLTDALPQSVICHVERRRVAGRQRHERLHRSWAVPSAGTPGVAAANAVHHTRTCHRRVYVPFPSSVWSLQDSTHPCLTQALLAENAAHPYVITMTGSAGPAAAAAPLGCDRSSPAHAPPERA